MNEEAQSLIDAIVRMLPAVAKNNRGVDLLRFVYGFVATCQEEISEVAV